MGSSKSPKEACFQVCKTKVGNSGFLHKTKLEGDPETLTFGFMQLFALTQPRAPAGLSISVWGFGLLGPLFGFFGTFGP